VLFVLIGEKAFVCEQLADTRNATKAHRRNRLAHIIDSSTIFILFLLSFLQAKIYGFYLIEWKLLFALCVLLFFERNDVEVRVQKNEEFIKSYQCQGLVCDIRNLFIPQKLRCFKVVLVVNS